MLAAAVLELLPRKLSMETVGGRGVEVSEVGFGGSQEGLGPPVFILSRVAFPPMPTGG